MRNLRLLVACTAIFALLFAFSCDDGGGDNPTTETNCTDGQDNDQDGLTDCDDSDCAAHPNCAGACNFNSLCEPALGENAANCTDCVTNTVCGNDTCEVGENETNCPEDCATGPYCGDGTCDANETAASCPTDCSGGDQCVAVEDLIEQNGCPGQSCTLLDAEGTIGCGAAGTTADYAVCSAAGSCLPGAICAGTGGESHCMPFCDTTDPSFVCPGSGACMFQISTAQGNVGLCGESDNCDPFVQSGCGSGEGCYFAAGDTTVCSTAGTAAVDASCQYLDECAPGLVCLGNPGACGEICDASFTCTTGTCQGIGTITGFPDYGFCQP